MQEAVENPDFIIRFYKHVGCTCLYNYTLIQNWRFLEIRHILLSWLDFLKELRYFRVSVCWAYKNPSLFVEIWKACHQLCHMNVYLILINHNYFSFCSLSSPQEISLPSAELEASPVHLIQSVGRTFQYNVHTTGPLQW